MRTELSAEYEVRSQIIGQVFSNMVAHPHTWEMLHSTDHSFYNSESSSSPPHSRKSMSGKRRFAPRHGFQLTDLTERRAHADQLAPQGT